MAEYPKMWVEGVRVYDLGTQLVGPHPGDIQWLCVLRLNNIPVGLEFHCPAQPGWGILDLVAWDALPEEIRA